MQYCYPLGEMEAAPPYATTSLPVTYETNTYAAYGEYGTNGVSYYQDPSMYYGQIPVEHYNLQDSTAHSSIVSENSNRESENYGTPGDVNSYYASNYQTDPAAGFYWPSATDNQVVTPATTPAQITLSPARPVPTTPVLTMPSVSSLTTTLPQRQAPESSRVHSPESAFCSSPTLTSPIPRNLYYSPNHFFRMVENLKDESQAQDDQESESGHSSSEDEIIFDLKSERNKKVGELLNDNEIKHRFSKVSNDCTSLFKILDRLNNTREDEMLSLATQERTISESLTRLNPKRSQVASKNEKTQYYSPVDESKYPSHYESPVYYNVPQSHQVECEKHLENEATKNVSKYSHNPNVTENQKVQVSHSYKHFLSRKKEIEKTKRNTSTATRVRKSKEKMEAHNINNLLELYEKNCVHQIDQDPNPKQMNLPLFQEVYDKIPKAKEKGTAKKESVSLEKMYRNDAVPSNTQLRAEVRAVLKKFKLKAKEVSTDITHKRIRLRKGSAKKCGSNLPKLPVLREIHHIKLPKKGSGPKDETFLPPISERAQKPLTVVTPRQKAQNTAMQMKNSTHSLRKGKDSSHSELPQVKKPLTNASSGLPARKEAPLATLRPLQKEKHVRRKRITSATGARTARKPLPPIDTKLQKRRPFK